MITFCITGLILGISSTLHCIGMCGPIALAVPLNRDSTLKTLIGSLQYNGGRIATYTILGVIAGSIGLTIHTFGFLQWLSILSGIALILIAWRHVFQKLLVLHAPNLFFSRVLNRSIGKVIRSKNPLKLLFLGSLNGLLPCGMVYAALLNAILAGSPFNSAMAMLFFGIGTLPAMLFVHFAFTKISNQQRAMYRKMLPFILTFVGGIIILRGMNLGIPYVSPKVNIGTTKSKEKNNSPEVEMSCCHDKTTCED